MSNKVWLIKEGNEIFGPFNQEEIIAKINNREIQEIDQIAATFSKFQIIKNSEEFGLLFKINEEKEHTHHEQTLSSTSVVDSVDPSVTGFFDVTVNEPTEKANTRPLPQQSLMKTPYKKSIAPLKKSIKQPIRTSYNADTVEEAAPVHIIKSNKMLRKMTTLFIGIFIILGSYLYYHLYYEQISEEKPSQPSQQQQQQQQQKHFFQATFYSAIEAKLLGNYEASRNLLQRILQLNPNDFEALFHLIEIMIIEKKYQEARHIINQKLQSTDHISFYPRLNNYLAIIALKNFNYDQAEQYLNKSLDQDPDFAPALINQGVLYFLRRSYTEAEANYALTIGTGPHDGVLILHRASNAVEDYLQNFETQMLQKMVKPLREYRDTSFDFKLEASLMLALIQYLLNNIEDAKNTLISILDLDLELTDQHIHDIQYYQDGLVWEHIMSWFQDFDEWDIDPELLAVYGFLIFRSQDQEEGKQQVEEALLFDENNHKILTLYAYIQDSLGLDHSSTTESAKRYNPNGLPLLLRARACEKEQNYFCTKHYWKQLSSHGIFPLQTLTGLAWTNEREQNRDQAKKMLEQAQKLSENYKPLLLLQAKLDKEVRL